MSIYQFETNIDKQSLNDFVKEHKYCNLLQSYEWAAIKNNWDHIYTGIYDENHHLTATGLVLIKELPMHFTMFYIPRGPIMDYTNKRLVRYYFSELKRIAKKRHCLFIKMDPAILWAKYRIGAEPKEEKEGKIIKTNLEDIGAMHQGFVKDFASSIQPRYNMCVDGDEFSLDNLTKKGRKNIKQALKQQLDIVIGKKELLDDFTTVMEYTEKRKDIELRSKEYYKKLLETYPDDGFIICAYLNIQKQFEEEVRILDQVKEDLAHCPENAKKKRFTLEEKLRSVQNKIKSLEEDRKNYGDRTVVCGTLTITWGRTSEILYAGMNEHFRKYCATYLTWYKTMEECFRRGCETCNMGGIEGNLTGGLVDYKSAFSPYIYEYLGEFDLPVNKLLFQASEKAYTKAKKRLNAE